MKAFGCLTKNQHVFDWVDEMAYLCRPDRVLVRWIRGRKGSADADAVERGVLIKLNQEKWPGCYYHRSNPNDVARVEQCTYICTETQEEAGPTNNWMAPRDMYRASPRGWIDAGPHQGDSVPHGAPGSPLAKVGIELTDSIYVVLEHANHDAHGTQALDHLAIMMTSTAASIACWM